VLVLGATFGVSVVRAEGVSATAADLVYDAADAIDEARAHFDEGRMVDRDRAITAAERFLDQAERIEPGLTRIQYERARLQQVDGEPDVAQKTLLVLMRDEMATVEHVRTAELLDSIRADLKLAPVGLVWRRTTTARNVGLATLGGGLGAVVAGIVLAFGTYAQDTADGRERNTQAAQRVGFVMAGIGGGLVVGGGVVTLGAQAQLGDMKAWLPGPWRLSGGAPPMTLRFALVVTPPVARVVHR
jgi:hypothetical protein